MKDSFYEAVEIYLRSGGHFRVTISHKDFLNAWHGAADLAILPNAEIQKDAVAAYTLDRIFYDYI